MWAFATGLADECSAVMELDAFGALFEWFERSAFRVEARDRYDVDEERAAFARFLQGRALVPRNAATDPWLALLAAARAAGRRIERVRIVGEPLTDYTRFEFAAYRENIAVGEKVRVVPRTTLTDADQGWASEDFWIFDDRLVVVLNYDNEGRFLGADQAPDITPYLKARRRELTLGLDFNEFVAETEL
jgi:hypothetical protein